MARASVIGILVAALVCVAVAGGAPAHQDAAPGAVAGISGGGPVLRRSPWAPLAAVA